MPSYAFLFSIISGPTLQWNEMYYTDFLISEQTEWSHPTPKHILLAKFHVRIMYWWHFTFCGNGKHYEESRWWFLCVPNDRKISSSQGTGSCFIKTLKFQHVVLIRINRSIKQKTVQISIHKYTTDFWQRNSENSMENKRYFQQMMIEQLDIQLETQ